MLSGAGGNGLDVNNEVSFGSFYDCVNKVLIFRFILRQALNYYCTCVHFSYFNTHIIASTNPETSEVTLTSPLKLKVTPNIRKQLISM